MNIFEVDWFDKANYTNDKTNKEDSIRKYYIFVTIQIFVKISFSWDMYPFVELTIFGIRSYRLWSAISIFEFALLTVSLWDTKLLYDDARNRPIRIMIPIDTNVVIDFFDMVNFPFRLRYLDIVQRKYLYFVDNNWMCWLLTHIRI